MKFMPLRPFELSVSRVDDSAAGSRYVLAQHYSNACARDLEDIGSLLLHFVLVANRNSGSVPTSDGTFVPFRDNNGLPLLTVSAIVPRSSMRNFRGNFARESGVHFSGQDPRGFSRPLEDQQNSP